MYQLFTQRFVVTAVLLFASLAAAYSQITMPYAPRGAYNNYFKYYSPGAANMPAGAEHTSNAVIGMFIDNIFIDNIQYAETGTGFLIYTRRNDHKVCMCTAAHIIEDMNANAGDIIAFDAYTKYLGKPSDQDPGLNEPVSGFKSTLHATLIAMKYRRWVDDYADAALLLVDEAELPLITPYMLGYSEEDVYNSPSSFYMIGHPERMAQRVADSLTFEASSPVFTPPADVFLFFSTGNNASGAGGSGAPVIYKGQGNFVTGIYNGGWINGSAFIPATEHIPGDMPIEYRQGYLRATKIAALMPAIRKHCWQQDSAGIAASQIYKQGLAVDNSTQVAKFLTNQLIITQAGIAAVADQTYGASNPCCILLKANLLTINCSVTPDDSLPRLFGLAKEVRLDTGFSYTASGNYYMDMNTVVPEQATSSTARTARGGGNPGTDGQQGGKDTAADFNITAGFSVYPNPSNDGIFYLSFPKNDDDYSLKVYSSDGRLMHKTETIAGQNPYRFSLAGMARDVYVLSLYKKQTNERLFSKTIIYQ